MPQTITKAGGGEVFYFCAGTGASMAPAHPHPQGSPATSPQRSVPFLNRNKGNAVRLCLLKEHLFSSSVTLLLLPNLYQATLYLKSYKVFIYFIILYCSLFPSGFSSGPITCSFKMHMKTNGVRKQSQQQDNIFLWLMLQARIWWKHPLFLCRLHFIRQIPQRQ